LTVLVVDDDPGEVERLKHIVEGLGHRVLTAATGSEAFAVLKTQQAYLALIDTELPDISGLELLRQVRLDPERRRVRVILANPAPTDDQIIFGFRYFTDAHFQRPLDAASLTKWLNLLDPGAEAPEPPEWSDCWNSIWDAERARAQQVSAAERGAG
jgi:CheY-like chemotaxis protein